jgi:hypothetical protein
VWAPSGREIFFADRSGQVVSVAVTPGASFQSGTPQPLFPLGDLIMPPFHQGFSVTPDGNSFIFLEDRSEVGSKARYAIVTFNWLDALKKHSPGQE